MRSIKDILSRLCLVYDVPNNRKLSKEININYNTISTWIKRDTIPYSTLHNIVEDKNVSFDWILTGVGETPISKDNNINLKLSDYNHSDDIKEIVELLKFAPSGFLTILKDKLKHFKELSSF